MNFANRGTTQILADVLAGAKGGNNKTAIIRSANTNHVRGSRYIETCLEADLMVKRNGSYALTEKGEHLLTHWQEVAELLPCE